MSEISLSSTSRTNLQTLQATASLISRTQDRLSSGLAVKTATDDAVKYFQAKSLRSRSADLNERKDSIDQGVSTLDAALKATDAMEKLVSQIKGKIDSSRSQTQTERKETAKQMRELVKQVQKLVDDASYKGLNLLNSTGSRLSVRFSEKATSKIDVDGNNLNATKLFLKTDDTAQGVSKCGGNLISVGLCMTRKLSGYDFANAGQAACFNLRADQAIRKLESTISSLRSKAASMATNADVLKVRLDFTKEYTSVLEAGADKMVLADLNSEGANLLALQTRQQIGIQALSFAGQSEQSVLSLFR
jgi:flagellin-like hook-associated protein FlgL